MATLASLSVKLGLSAKQFVSGLATARTAVKSFSDSSRSRLDRVKESTDRATGALRTFTKAMAIGSALAGATVAMHALSGAAGGLVTALVTASGSLLLLPAAGLAAGVAIGALKIGMSGFGDALKSMSDPKKFAEALKKLAPAAQDAARAIAGLKPRFDELKKSVQNRLFAGLGAQITAIGNTYLPILDERFGRVSDAVNGAAHSIAAMLREGTRIADIKSITNAGATAFENLTGAAGPLVAALVDIATVGATFLDPLTSGARGAAIQFGAFISRARESGQLAGWIRGGLDALSQLGHLLANIGGIIGSVFGAMNSAGGSTIAVLVQLTGEARAFLNSAQGSAALTTVFTTIHDTVQTLLPGVRALGSALVGAITSIAPALPGLGAAFSAAAQSVAPLVGFLGDLAGTILPPLIAVLGFLAPALGPLAGYIGAIVAAVKAWSIAQALLNAAFFVSPIGWLIIAIGALIAVLALAWHHSDTFRAIVVGAWAAISSAVSAAVSWVVGFVKANWPLLLSIIGGPLGLVVALVITNWDRIKGLVSAGVTAVLSVFGWFGRLGGMVAGFFGAATSAAAGKIGELIGWVRGIPGRVLAALGNLGSLLYRAGRNVIQGLINGIMGMIGAVGRAIGRVASKIRNALPFSPAREGPLSGRGSPAIAGQKIATMVAGGMLDKVGAVAGAAHRMAGVLDSSLVAGQYGSASPGQLGALRDTVQQQLALQLPRNVQTAVAGAGAGGQAPLVRLTADDALMAALLEQLRQALRERGLGGVLG